MSSATAAPANVAASPNSAATQRRTPLTSGMDSPVGIAPALSATQRGATTVDGMVASGQRPQTLLPPPPPLWQKALPLGALGLGVACLAGSVLLGFKRSVGAAQASDAAAATAVATATPTSAVAAADSRAPSAPMFRAAPPAARPLAEETPRELFWKPLPNSKLPAGMLAAKALAYGTALCLMSSAAVGLTIAWYLDVQDVRRGGLSSMAHWTVLSAIYSMLSTVLLWLSLAQSQPGYRVSFLRLPRSWLDFRVEWRWLCRAFATRWTGRLAARWVSPSQQPHAADLEPANSNTTLGGFVFFCSRGMRVLLSPAI